MSEVRTGLVIQHGANRSLVLEGGADAPVDSQEWNCTLRGRLRKGKREEVRPVVIGDIVDLVPTDDSEATGVIERVHPRRNQISRPQPSGGREKRREQVVIANLDRLWVVVSLAQPPLNLRFLDRILAAAQLQGVDSGVVLNKSDLDDAVPWTELVELYEGLGIPVCVTSAEDGQGMDALGEALQSGIAAFVGLSGVGKSSLLQVLEPQLNLRVASVGEKSGHGRHTTTQSRLYRLDRGAWLADTPGMREFGVWGFFKRELEQGFVEIAEAAVGCRFRDCQHVHEPGCTVQEAVASGEINSGRYESYKVLRGELPENELDWEGKR